VNSTTAMAATLDIRLKRINKTYTDGDTISGYAVIRCKQDCGHNGLTLNLTGTVSMQLSSKNVGVFEAFYNSIKPIQLTGATLELAKPGKFTTGLTEIPFEIPFKSKGNKTLYETYHGVFINIQYVLQLDLKRSLLNKDLSKTCEFLVEYNPKNSGQPSSQTPVTFAISPDSVVNVQNKASLPKFRVTGQLTSSHISISEPLSGELVIEQCATRIKSVELQLVRVETCGCLEGYAKETTEIQNIQVADGDAPRGIKIPLHMVLPRLFTCPSVSATNFRIEFEVNIVVVFQDDYLVSENIHIRVSRF
ncbi:hypothetical protein BOX15_Mlig009232g1, partial [Macrostomum lignano]